MWKKRNWLYHGSCFFEVIDAEYDPGSRGRIDQIDVDSGVGDSTADASQLARPIRHIEHQHLTILLHFKSSLSKYFTRWGRVLKQDVDDPFPFAGKSTNAMRARTGI